MIIGSSWKSFTVLLANDDECKIVFFSKSNNNRRKNVRPFHKCRLKDATCLSSRCRLRFIRQKKKRKIKKEEMLLGKRVRDKMVYLFNDAVNGMRAVYVHFSTFLLLFCGRIFSLCVSRKKKFHSFCDFKKWNLIPKFAPNTVTMQKTITTNRDQGTND